MQHISTHVYPIQIAPDHLPAPVPVPVLALPGQILFHYLLLLIHHITAGKHTHLELWFSVQMQCTVLFDTVTDQWRLMQCSAVQCSAI